MLSLTPTPPLSPMCSSASVDSGAPGTGHALRAKMLQPPWTL